MYLSFHLSVGEFTHQSIRNRLIQEDASELIQSNGRTAKKAILVLMGVRTLL